MNETKVERADEVENAGRTRVTGPDHGVRISAKTIIVVLAINFTYFAQLVGVVGSGFLAQPISNLLGGSGQEVWLSSAITILTVALSPPVTQAADYWGRKVFIASATLFGCVGAIIVSRAQTMGTAIAGFAIMGVCYGSQPLLHAVVSEILPRKHRPVAQACINFSSGLGVIIGICMGGGLLRSGQLERFRIYCYVVASIFAFAFFSIMLLYHPLPRELQVTLTFTEKIRKLDWTGYLFFVPGLVLFCVGLANYGNPYAFGSGYVLGPFVVSIGLMIAFFAYEWRFNKHGVLNHSFFVHRNYALALLNVFVEGLAFFAANSYYIFEVNALTGDDILISALHFALISIVSNIASVLIGLYSSRRKAIRSPNILGFSLFILFFVLMAATTTKFPLTVFWGYPIFAGFGMGILLPTIIVAAQLAIPPELISPASGLLIAVRSLGAAVGLAVNNAIYNNGLSKTLKPKIADAVLPLGFPQSSLAALISAITASNTTALDAIPGITNEIIAAAGAGLKEAYVLALRNAWIAAACFCSVSFVGRFHGIIPFPVELDRE